MRADALRNQSAVLHAAEGLYSERGLAVSLNEIAKRAGVGNATLYRHFANHDDLAADVFGEQMKRYCKIAEDAALISDASVALRSCVRQICELQASNRGLADLIGTLEFSNERLDALRARTYAALQRLIRRARRVGRRSARLHPGGHRAAPHRQRRPHPTHRRRRPRRVGTIGHSLARRHHTRRRDTRPQATLTTSDDRGNALGLTEVMVYFEMPWPPCAPAARSNHRILAVPHLCGGSAIIRHFE